MHKLKSDWYDSFEDPVSPIRLVWQFWGSGLYNQTGLTVSSQTGLNVLRILSIQSDWFDSFEDRVSPIRLVQQF